VKRLLALGLVLLAAGCGGGDDASAPPKRDPQLDGRLREAAQANRVDEARELVEEGADVNAKNANGLSPYLYATSEVGPEPELLELLLERGADVRSLDDQRSTGLIRAAQRGYPELVRPPIDAGAELDHVNNLGWTALTAAVVLGDGTEPYLETVKLLLDAGADPKIPDQHGVQPVVHAELLGQTEVVEVLREAEAAS
jgi:uncharacterized protein